MERHEEYRGICGQCSATNPADGILQLRDVVVLVVVRCIDPVYHQTCGWEFALHSISISIAITLLASGRDKINAETAMICGTVCEKGHR
jgi:hypothetical protein